MSLSKSEKCRIAALAQHSRMSDSEKKERSRKISDSIKLARVTKPNMGHFKPHTSSAKRKISVAKKGKPTWNKGLFGKYNLTEEHRKNIRLGAIKYFREVRSIPWPCIGAHECSSLDAIGRALGETIYRQYEVSGYFVDGYCPRFNLAIEVDEPHHFIDGELSDDDLRRQKMIEKELKCSFLRIRVPNIKGGE